MSSENRTLDASPDCGVITKFGFITESPNCCQSNDVTCRDGRVVAIDSSFQAARSRSSSSSSSTAVPRKDFTIPSDIDRLTELERFRVVMSQGNFYSAGTTIPRSIGKLSKLTELDLSNGGLSGSIPVEIADIPNLGYLRLTNHVLTGTIPPAIGNLKNLTHLDLSRNRLTGSLPTGLADLDLITVDVTKNSLTGIVPKLSPSIDNCELNSHFDGNNFTCYGGGARAPFTCDVKTLLLRSCSAGRNGSGSPGLDGSGSSGLDDSGSARLDVSGPSPFMRTGFIVTIAIAVLIPILSALCATKAKRVPTLPEEDKEKPVAVADTTGEGAEATEAAAPEGAAATDEANEKKENPKRNLASRVKLILALEIVVGVALAFLFFILAERAGATLSHKRSHANLSASDRDYLILLMRTVAGLGVWSSLLAVIGLACAVRKHLQGFKLFAALLWGYIFALPVSLAVLFFPFSIVVKLRHMIMPFVICFWQFYWGIIFAAFIADMEDEKERALMAEGTEEFCDSGTGRVAAVEEA